MPPCDGAAFFGEGVQFNALSKVISRGLSKSVLAQKSPDVGIIAQFSKNML